MKGSLLLLLLIVFRVASVFFVQTWFVPDEIFQSVEVAHQIIFGSGHLSWEWKHGLRSVLHPFFISLGYVLLKLFSLDSVSAVVYLPRLMHAVIFAVSDYSFYCLAKRLLSPYGARFALFCYLTSWFVWYCASRTLSNSLETALMLIALNWYPFSRLSASLPEKKYWPYFAIAFISILIRPTAVLIWAPLGFWHMSRSKTPLKLLFSAFVTAILPIFLITYILDSLFYGHLTVTVWNFAMFNVFKGGSEHFGVNPWYWYFSEGLFSVLTVHMFPIILGIILAFWKRGISLIPFLLSAFYIIFHSLLAHKEHRFLLPVIPLLCLYAGYFFTALSRHFSVSRLFLCFTLVTVNVSLASYFGMYHQSGPFAATDYIVSHAASSKSSSSHFGILQLLPCYSMPQYSHFHGFNVSIYALDCTPNLDYSPTYDEEADEFFGDPKLFLSSRSSLLSDAAYVVAYSGMYEALSSVLEQANFSKPECFFHAHFLTSDRQDNRICVGCKL